MGKALLIVESPAKARTIQKYLGRGFEVVASKGHIKDLPKRGGVDVEKGFEERYEIIDEKGKSEVIRTLLDKARKADRILLATDPDREGEAIAWHLHEEIRAADPDVPIERVLFNEITRKGIREGLEHPRPLDPNLYEAQRTRRVLDRIGGYPLSDLLWRKLAYGLSAGRVQTPALRLIVDRQKEIESFVPRDHWVVEAQLDGGKPPSFTATLVEVDGNRLERIASRPATDDEALARQWAEALRGARYRVRSVERREQRRRAPPPYTTSKLQQDASTRLGMAPRVTMRIAQQLYEGVEIGRGENAETVGLVTYIRTDSVRLSPDAVAECRAYIARHYPEALPDTPNVFRSRKGNVQDAHEAIRPTRMDLPPEAVARWLKPDQLKLYRLVWNRFVACQMAPAVYEIVTADIEAEADGRRFGLRASGSVLRSAGWRQIWGVRTEPLAGEEEDRDDEGRCSASSDPEPEARAEETRELPALDEGQPLRLVDPPGVTSTHRRTEPPPQYTEASLVKKLEEEGIGRPSTYAEILSKVQARDYVRKENGRLVPTPLGRLVVERLVADRFDLADIGFTRRLEEQLDAIAEARATRLEVLAPFHERIQSQIRTARETPGKWWPPPEPLDEACPLCGQPLVKRWGRNGPFVGCSGYEREPRCEYTRNLEGTGAEGGETPQPEPTAYSCERCGRPMLKRWGRNGWFLGCSGYPKLCRNSRPLPLGIRCPQCGEGELVELRARGKGRRVFYGCTRWSREAGGCDYRLWQRPVALACDACGHPFLVEAGNRRNRQLECPRCKARRPADSGETSGSNDATDAMGLEPELPAGSSPP
ncbi:MAG: type I DNA topoisomerase [Myxococcota bacterium]|nr:type I DNA topoisomerase [Myxococcota bacterium]MDW8363911.1 type I DNA topoisomerase [Myxococcales bacterium]